MIILVDFENTHVNGMEGYTYLNETDTVVVYYSDENSAVTRGMVEDLKSRDVNVRMVKLLKQHANALDMYIASTTGMFLDTGEKICIVSKDKGYAAVRDFWHSLRGAEILLGETIEECFLHSVANDDPRIRRVKERSQKALLINSFETMNKIPTRPTLSRSNARKRRNEELDTTKNLEPVAILPNPLLKTVPTALPIPAETAEESSSAVTENLQIEDALPVSVDNVGASAGESGAASLNRGGYTNLRPENNRRSSFRKQGRDSRNGRNRSERREQSEAVFYGEERMPENEDSRAAGKQQNQNQKEELHSENNVPAVKESAAAAAAQDKLAAEAEKKTTILNEKKNTERVLPRINKNQISYVYDPATGTMKRLDPAAEAEAAENAAEEGKAAAEEKASAAGENETAAENSEAATEAAAAAEAETEEEVTPAENAENEAVSLEALGIVPMEALEKYGPGINTPHQYYVKLVKTFGKAVGKEIFNATKKEMQAELKRRKQLQQAEESAETAEKAAEAAAEAEHAEAADQAEAESATSVETEAEVTAAEENAVTAADEEHPVVEALPVHVENNAIVMTEEDIEQAEETAAEIVAEQKSVEEAKAEKTVAESVEKSQNGGVSEEEALAAAQEGRYVQLSMDFAENGDINALTAEVPTEKKVEPQDAANAASDEMAQETAAEAAENAQEEPVKKPARKRRSRKAKTEEAAEQPEASAAAETAEPEKAKKSTRKKTSRKKTKTENAEGVEAESAVMAEAEKTATEVGEPAEPKSAKKRGGRRKKAEAAETAAQAEV